MPRILFIDVDGTLVDYHNRLPESAVTAIRAARAAGHRVYLCTGRSRAEMPEMLWEIGVDGMVGGNGSYVEDAGQVVWHQTLTGAQCRAIVDWLHSRGLEFYLETNAGLFQALGDTWELDGATWTKRAPATSPAGRSNNILIYDAARKLTLQFGGLQNDIMTASAELWGWNGTSWSKLY